MKEHHRVTRERIAQRAARRLRQADLDGQAALAKAAQAALRAKLCAELKQKKCGNVPTKQGP